ncbi:MAG: biotin--protein ligase [Xanthomonadales bacterium]|nr:biotin--protein ligase [Xanthomonadales bacterium]
MHGEYKVPGGKLVVVDLDTCAGRLCHVQVSGDFFLEPPEALALINAALEGQAIDASESQLEQSVASALGSDTMMFGFSAAAVATSVRRALAA